MKAIVIPKNYDYVGVYLTDNCHLKCDYCITSHYAASFLSQSSNLLSVDAWIDGLNRLILPKDVPISFQGGEPFLYPGIWDILEQVEHKVDIMTALPPHIKKEDFLSLKTLVWNKRNAPYPTIRVSYHKGQHDFYELVERVAELGEILSIGIYYLEHPSYSEDEIDELKRYASKKNVELRSKEFLGEYNGRIYGTYLYPEAVVGKKLGINVKCKNTVVPIAPDGNIYRCHSDLYFKRDSLALGNIMDNDFSFSSDYISCSNFGLCSECDVKIKTNHYQQYGYTSVDIKKNEYIDKVREI